MTDREVMRRLTKFVSQVFCKRPPSCPNTHGCARTIGLGRLDRGTDVASVAAQIARGAQLGVMEPLHSRTSMGLSARGGERLGAVALRSALLGSGPGLDQGWRAAGVVRDSGPSQMALVQAIAARKAAPTRGDTNVGPNLQARPPKASSTAGQEAATGQTNGGAAT